MPGRRFSSLLEVVKARASSTPGQAAFVFDSQRVSYAQLWEQIRRMASHLLNRGVAPGDRVVIALPNGPEFFAAFYGCQLAAGISVPINPDYSLREIRRIARQCRARRIVVSPEVLDGSTSDQQANDEPWGKVVLTVSDSHQCRVTTAYPGQQEDDTCFVQFTSGSTGLPKGVQISHRNLITNIKQLIDGMQINRNDVFASWLPVWHDMGLVLKTMVPFYLGIPTILLPASFTRIRSWFAAIEKYSATFTAAPDFAYRMGMATLRRKNPHDLSSLRVALNAAEPIRKKTILDFEDLCGRSGVMIAGYGLAEATVGVTSSPPGKRPTWDSSGVISVGSGFPGVELAISQEGALATPGLQGEILVRSPANTSGYLGNPEKNEQLFLNDGFIRTGDVGYLDSTGDLYVTGRLKNIIISMGRNLAPSEIEGIADELPFVRLSAALGIDRGRIEGEQVYVFAELKAKNPSYQTLHEMTVSLVQQLNTHLGVRPGRTYLLRPKSIPRTANGKLRHSELKQMFLGGSLKTSGAVLYPN
jgi:acyl-CoA synthetase (AMP-forming)/AMP-acid ligase II